MSVNGYEIQTYAVEFDVPGDLDGETLSPPIQAPRANDDPQQLYRPTVPDNLGLIDVDYVVTEVPPGEVGNRLGTRGNRYVAWFWLEANSPGSATARLEVVDATDGTIRVQELIGDLSGQSEFYKRDGILVPQGSLLRISGFTGGAKVRLHIQVINGLDEMAKVQQALCCADDVLGPFNVEDALTYDYRQTTQNSGNSFVPAGTSATAHGLRVKRTSRLASFFYWGVIPPAAGESVAIRLFRFTPTTLQQVTNTFTLNAGNFVVSTQVDLSSFIIPGIFFDPLDVLACSFVHAGPQVLQPLLVGWTFTAEPGIAPLGPPPPPLPIVWPPS